MRKEKAPTEWMFRQLEPQKARGVLKEHMWKSDDWTAEEKFDGDRRIAQFNGGIVRFTGSRKSVKDGLFVEKTANVPHLSNYPNVHLPPIVPHKTIRALEGTVLDGEMIIPDGFVTGAGGRSKHVTAVMGSLPEEAVRKQLERGRLRYAVFDILFYKGQDLRGLKRMERRTLLFDVIPEWGNPFAFLVPATRDKKQQFLEHIWAEGGEGVILKHDDHIYGQHLLWVKVKDERTADVVIMGFKEAKQMSEKVTGEVSITKYAAQGLIGAIVFGQYKDGVLTEMGSTSGMDDATRVALSGPNPGGWVGQVIEIKHYGREPTGAFRHPQFKRLRFDKNAEACVYDPNEV